MNVGSEVTLRTVDGLFSGLVYAVNQRQKYLTLRDGNYSSHYLAHLTRDFTAACVVHF